MDTSNVNEIKAADTNSGIDATTPIAAVENLEPRLMLSGAWDNVSEIFIEQGTYYHPDVDGPAGYMLELGFEALEGSITSARFHPSSLPNDWTDIVDNDVFDGAEEWFFELNLTDPLEVENYVSETYVLEITFATSEVLSTSISLDDGTGSMLTAPTDVPEIISPLMNRTNVAIDTQVSWAAVSDAEVDLIELNIDRYQPTGSETDPMDIPRQGVAEYELAASATSSVSLSLDADSLYSAELLLDNFYEGATAEGVATFASRHVMTSVTFNTYSTLLDPIDSAYLIRGFDATDNLYGFEFGFESSQLDWFESARLLSPDGGWSALTGFDPFGSDGGEWYLEFVNGDSGVVDQYFPFGLYELEIDFGGFVLARTSFDYSDPQGVTGDPIALPTQVPNLTAPADGATDVALDATFTWDDVTDPKVGAVELEIDATDGSWGIGQDFSPAQTSYAQSELSPGTTYEAELSFWNGAQGQVNPDGVSFDAGTFTVSRNEFTTESTASNPWLNIDEVEIAQGVFYENGTPTYWFDAGFDTLNADWFTSARIQGPDAQWHALTVETFGDGQGWENTEAYFEFESSLPGDLDVFGAGTYVLEVTLTGGSTITTSFEVAEIAAPTQTPQFTRPLDGATDVATDVTFAWDAMTDPNIVVAEFMVEDDMGHNVIDAELSPADIDYPQTLLSPGAFYTAELGFFNGAVGANADGVNFTVGRGVETMIGFTTAGQSVDPVLSNINDLTAQLGAVHNPDGSTEYVLDVFMGSDATGWFETAEISAGTSGWIALVSEMDDGAAFSEGETGGEYYRWSCHIIETDLLGLIPYLGGDISLRITLSDASSVTTQFAAPGTAIGVTETPAFTYPAQGASDVSVTPQFTWTAPTDAAVNEVRCDVLDISYGGMMMTEVAPSLDGAALPTYMQLMPGADYSAQLTFMAISAPQYNSDNVPYNVNTYQSAWVDFTTESDPLLNIDEVFIEQGTAYVDGAPSFWFEAGFETMTTDWFTAARIQSPDAQWHALSVDGGVGEGETGEGDDKPMEAFFELASSQQSDLDGFGDGLYVLEITLTGGTVITTSFDVGGVTAPTQVPQFVAPTAGATDVAPDATFQWQPVTDPNAQYIELMVEDEFGEVAIDASFSPADTQMLQNLLLSNTAYSAELSFAGEGFSTNSDGVGLLVSRGVDTVIDFTTGEGAPVLTPLDHVLGAEFERGVVTADGGDLYVFEFILVLDAMDFFDTIEISPDGQTFHMLEWDYDVYGDGSDGQFEYVFEQIETDASALAAFGNGAYTLRFTLPDASQVETGFTVTGLDAVVSQVPTFTAPTAGATDVAVDAPFAWSPVTDPSVTGVELFVATETDVAVIDEDLAATAGGYDPAVDLLAGVNYSGELTFFADGGAQVNDDQVAFKVNTYRTSMIDFATAGQFDVAALMDDVYLEQGVLRVDEYASASGQVEDVHYFEFGFMTDVADWFSYGWLETPGGESLSLVNFDYDAEVGPYEWSVRADGTDAAALSAFGAGIYTLNLELLTGQSIAVDFELADTLAQPGDYPEILSPADGMDNAPLSGLLQWSPATDASIDVIYASIGAMDGKEYFDFEDLAPATSSAAYSGLSEATAYFADVEFIDAVQTVNADGVAYAAAMISASRTRFNSYNAWSNVQHLALDRGVAQESDGTHYRVSLEMAVADAAWLTAAELSAPDGTVLPLQNDGDTWWTGVLDTTDPQVAASFGAGTYTLTITLADQSRIATEIDFDAQLAAPTQTPMITSPAAGATDVPLDAVFAWDAVTDGKVSEIWITILGENDELIEHTQLTSDLTSFQRDYPLAFNGAYKVQVAFHNSQQGQNDDEIYYTSSNYTASQVAFSTLASNLSVTEHFEGLEFWTGVAQTNGQTSYTPAMVRLYSETADWVDSIEVSTDGTTWLALDMEDMGDYGFQWRLFTTLLDFSGGSAAIRFTLPGGEVETTDFAFPTTGATLPPLPQVTNPAPDGAAMDPESMLTWADPGATVAWTDITVVDAFGEVVSRNYADAGQTQAELWLKPDDDYTLTVQHFTQADDQTNDDGVMARFGAFSQSNLDFRTGFYANLWRMIDFFDIVKGEITLPDGQQRHMLEVSLESLSDSWYMTAWAKAARTAAFDDAHELVVDHDNLDEDYYLRSLKILSDDPQAVAEFDDGVWWLKIQTASGTQQITLDVTGLDDRDLPTPVITSPANGAQAVLPFSPITWQPLTGEELAGIAVRIFDSTGTLVVDEELPADATQYVPSGLSLSEQYTLQVVAVGHENEAEHAEGFNYAALTVSASQLEFTTAASANVWDLLSAVEFELSDSAFELIVSTPVAGWFASAEIQDLAGNWHALAADDGKPADGVGAGEDDFEYAFNTDRDGANSADFGPGDYTLRFTLAGGRQYATTVTLDDQVAAPTQNPVFTAPTGGAQDVAMDVLIAWEAVTDQEIDEIWLEVSRGETDVLDAILAPDAVSRAVSLLGAADYTARLTFVNSATATNAEGVSVTTATMTEAAIDFRTESPLTDIVEVYIDQGIAYANAASPVYIIELGFEAVDGAVSSARFRQDVEGSSWITLDEDADSDGDGSDWSHEVSGSSALDLSLWLDSRWVFEFTFANGQVFSTAVAQADSQDGGAALVQPTQIPQFTNLVHNRTYRDGTLTPQWSAIVDANVTSQEFELAWADGSEDAEGDAQATSLGGFTLEADTVYTASLLWDNARNGQTDEGVDFFVTKYVENSIEINTYASLFDAFSSIDFTREQLIAADGAMSDAVAFELSSDQTGLFNKAELITPDGARVALTAAQADGLYTWSAFSTAAIDFGYGDYELVLVTDDVTASTVLSYDAGAALPADSPALTSPAAGALNVRPNADVAWTAPSDAATTEVALDVLSGGQAVIERSLDPAVSQISQTVLGFNTTYQTALSFINDYALVNELGLDYGVETAKTALGGFTTARALRPVDIVEDVYIERGLMELPGGADPALKFAFGMLTVEADQILGATLVTPTAQSYALTAVAAPDPQAGYEWLLEVESTQSVSSGFGAGDMADFVSGVYTLELEVNDIETVATRFLLDASIAAPTTPQFVAPTDGATAVDPAARLEWTALDDAMHLGLIVTDLDSGQPVISAAPDVYATRYVPAALTGGATYSAELLAANGYANLANVDGVSFSVSMYSGRRIAFATVEAFDPVADIADVSFSRGFVSEAGQPKMAFSFGMSLANARVATVRLQSPDGNWYDLAQNGEAWSFDVESAAAADVAGFTSGFYTLKITSTDAQVVTTTFEVAGMQPPLPPTMLAPLSGQTAVDATAPIAWSVSPSSGIDAQALIITDSATDTQVVAELLSPTTAQYDAGLDYEGTYTLELTSIVESDAQTSADGVAFTLSTFAGRRLSFTTAAEFNPLEHIDGVDVHVGMLDPVGALYSTWFVLDVDLQLADGASFEALEYSVDGAWYPAADSSSLAFATTDLQQRDALLSAGVLPLRITYGGGRQIVTDIPLPAIGEIPGAGLALTGPADGATVMPDAAITWTTDGAAPIAVMVAEGGFSETPGAFVYETELASDAVSVVPEGLEYLTDYTVYAGQTATADATSGDGLAIATDIYNLTAAEFSTVEASVDLVPTLGAVTGLSELNLWGATGAVTVSVTNTGTSTAAGDATVTVYFSEDPWYDAADTPAGSASATLALGSGQSRDVAIDLTVPQLLSAGDYYLVAVLSTGETIVEDSVTNNEIVGDAYAIAAPVVDLAGSITAVEFSGEGRIIAGSDGAVSVEIVNQGNIPATGLCTVQIYASASSSFDPDGALLGARSVTLAMPADGTLSVAVPIQLPTRMATGYYTFHAVIDSAARIVESNEDNNVVAWDSPVSIEAQVVDFTGEITSHSFGVASLAGDVGEISMTLVNQGNWPIRKGVRMDFYASTSGQVDAQAVKIGQGATVLNLEADGGTQDATFRVRLPRDMANGDYYLVADIDATDAVIENNEINNTLLSSATVNIVEPFVDLSGSIAEFDYTELAVAGDRGNVVVTVANNGNVAARGGGVLLRLYASETLDIADGVEIGQARIGLGIQPGDSKDFKVRTELPADMDSGFYYLIAVIDADADDSLTTGGVIEESTEMNNTAIADAPLEVARQMIDLTATLGESTLHASPMPGMTGKVEVVLGNDGNVPSGLTDVTVKIYGSLDGSADPAEDMLLGESLARRLNLAPGAAKTVTVNVTIPDGAASDVYQLIAVVDSENAVDESVEDNNQVVAAETFEVVEPFADVATSISEVDLGASVLPGDRGRVTITLTNEGNIPARGPVALTLYVSDSAVKDAGTEVEVASMTTNVNLGPDASRDYPATIVIPDEVELFEELYFIAVLAPSADVADSDAANDTAALGGPVLDDPIRDLFGEVQSFDLPASIIAGDRGMARVQVTNQGNIPAAGQIEVGLYAIATGDPGAVAVAIGDAIVDGINLAPGRSANYTFRFEVPADLDAGVDYRFYVAIDATDAISEADETNNTLDLGDPVTYVQRFGSFDGHNNVSLTATDDLGGSAEFLMIGDGYGEVATNDAGQFVLTLTGTSNNSRLFIRTANDEIATIYSLTADGDMNAISGETTDLADGGFVSVAGGINQLELRNVADQHELTLGGDGSQKASITFHDVTDLNITSDSPIQSLSVHSWTDTDGDDLITAPWIGSLSSDGAFAANLMLSGVDAPGGGTLGSVRIDGSVDDGDDADVDWDVTGSIGSIDLASTVDNFEIAAESIRSLSLADVDSIVADLTGELTLVKAASIADGAFAAESIRNLTVDGGFGAAIALSSTDATALGLVKVGSLDYTDPAVADWTVAGGVGNVNADTIDNLRIVAGGGLRTFIAGAVTDSSLGETGTSIGEVTLVKVDSWSGGEIVADSVVNFASGGDVSPDMTVGAGGNDAFRTVRIDGGITGGTWTISGDMGVLTVGGDLTGWTLDLGDAELKSFRLGAATDTSITAGEIGTINSDAWLGGTITAASVRAVSISGDADIDMAVAGDVGNVKVSGDMTGGTWTVGGQVNALMADSFDGLDITADVIKTINTGGDLTNASLTLTADLDARGLSLTKLNVNGAMDTVSVRSVGSIGTVTVGKMVDSVVFAGVKSDYLTDANSDGVVDLPVTLDDFVSPEADVLAQVKAVVIKGGRDITGDLFTNSSVAAGSVNKAIVKDATLDNGSQAFGIAGVESVNVIWQQGSSRYVYGRNWADNDGDFTVLLAEAAPGSPWFHRS